jgi:hypothetical protein
MSFGTTYGRVRHDRRGSQGLAAGEQPKTGVGKYRAGASRGRHVLVPMETVSLRLAQTAVNQIVVHAKIDQGPCACLISR